jgi:hypothetical protein
MDNVMNIQAKQGCIAILLPFKIEDGKAVSRLGKSRFLIDKSWLSGKDSAYKQSYNVHTFSCTFESDLFGTE